MAVVVCEGVGGGADDGEIILLPGGGAGESLRVGAVGVGVGFGQAVA